jgi:hypothetical protein
MGREEGERGGDRGREVGSGRGKKKRCERVTRGSCLPKPL